MIARLKQQLSLNSEDLKKAPSEKDLPYGQEARSSSPTPEKSRVWCVVLAVLELKMETEGSLRLAGQQGQHSKGSTARR